LLSCIIFEWCSRLSRFESGTFAEIGLIEIIIPHKLKSWATNV
jgi:hypothetical protein